MDDLTKKRKFEQNSTPLTSPPSETQQTSTYQHNAQFPRFLLITPQADKLTESPFIIEKTLSACIGTPKDVKRLRSGSLLVEVERQKQAEQLLKLKDFFKTPVTVQPHKTLNTSRGLIRCPDLKGISDGDIKTEMSEQGVIDARRIRVSGKVPLRIKTQSSSLLGHLSCLPR